MRSIGIMTQARYGSSRLKGKVLKTVNGKTLLEIHLSRLKRSKLATHFVLATTHEPEALEIAKIGRQQGFEIYQGSEDDVLDRYYQAARANDLDVVIRVTSDCPLNDGALIDEMVRNFLESDADYLSNINPPTYPDGMDVEVFSFRALEKAWEMARDIKDREHVTPFIRNNLSIFKLINVDQKVNQSHLRLTVDTSSDLLLIDTIIAKLGDDKDWYEYANYLLKNPSLISLNQNEKRNSGY
jgi:spore coat polysaccharide biosynthesis protein SpsF